MRDGTLILAPGVTGLLRGAKTVRPPACPDIFAGGRARARAPLQACFGVRVLEESLCREPQVGEPALGGTDLDCFRSMVWERGPSDPRKLAAERQDERYAAEGYPPATRAAACLLPVNRLAVRTPSTGQPVGPADYEVTGTFVGQSESRMRLRASGDLTHGLRRRRRGTTGRRRSAR